MPVRPMMKKMEEREYNRDGMLTQLKPWRGHAMQRYGESVSLPLRFSRRYLCRIRWYSLLVLKVLSAAEYASAVSSHRGC